MPSLMRRSPRLARSNTSVFAVQQPFKKSLTTEKTANAAWRTKPTFYAVSSQDRTINPDLERFMAKRMGANTIEIEASHLALISHPGAIRNLILEALAVWNPTRSNSIGMRRARELVAQFLAA